MVTVGEKVQGGGEEDGERVVGRAVAEGRGDKVSKELIAHAEDGRAG